MCLICIEWEKEKLTNHEALRAVGEISMFSKDEKQKEHLEELTDKIIKKAFLDAENE